MLDRSLIKCLLILTAIITPLFAECKTAINKPDNSKDSTTKMQKIKTVFVGTPFIDGIYYYHHGDMKKAYVRFKKSCQNGVDMGCFYAGKILDEEIIQSIKKAILFYGRACKNGFKPACVQLEREMRRCINDTGDRALCLGALKQLIQNKEGKPSLVRKKPTRSGKAIRDNVSLTPLPPPPQINATTKKIKKTHSPFSGDIKNKKQASP